MKNLLSGVAIVAVLAIAAAVPASAQRTGPGPGATTGTGPGVTPPGGLGPSSPLSNLPGPGAPGYAPPPGYQGQPGQPPAAGQPPSYAPGEGPTSSAYPPTHRHARPHHGYVAAHHTTKGRPVSGNANMSANQMNADELARLQGANYSNPPPAALPYGAPPGAPDTDTAVGRPAGRGVGRDLRNAQ